MSVNGKEMQQVDKFHYLGVKISTDGGMGGRNWLIGCFSVRKTKKAD